MFARRIVARLLVALAMVLSSSAVVSAGEPATDSGSGFTGTGIDIRPGGPTTPEELGYTARYAEQKEAEFRSRLAANLTGSLATTLGAPASASLGGFVSYHQKTTYNCLPALGQSILHQAFGGYTFPSVTAKQGTAAQEPGTITAGMLTTTAGTNDNNALSYINGQYAANGSPWRYIATNNTVFSDFQFRLTNEVGSLGHLLYVRVDLTNQNYAWHQSSAAQHATGGIAYTSSGANVTIADPFTHLSGSTCVATPYTSTPDTSCNWVNYSTYSWWLAKDIVRNGVQPMWA